MSAVASALPAGKSKSRREPVWLSPEMVCERVPGLTVEILSDRRKKGLRPDWRKPSQKTVIYEQSEIDDWVESTRHVGRAS